MPSGQKPRIKELHEMSLRELWGLFPVILGEHQPQWADWYAAEERALLAVLADRVFRISHIGSTAVPGLLAKPIVDVLLEVREGVSPTDTIEPLRDGGWIVMARSDGAGTVDLNKGYTKMGFAEKVFHLHIKPLGDHGEPYFRDYLKDNKDVAEAYARLKTELAAAYEHDRDAYTEQKTDFVKQHTDLARRRYPGRYTP